jgi:hypothetical protein
MSIVSPELSNHVLWGADLDSRYLMRRAQRRAREPWSRTREDERRQWRSTVSLVTRSGHSLFERSPLAMLALRFRRLRQPRLKPPRNGLVEFREAAAPERRDPTERPLEITVVEHPDVRQLADPSFKIS